MEHNEGCLNKGKSFPCCADEMCPCDSYNFEKLMEENSRYRKALEDISEDKWDYNKYGVHHWDRAQEALKGGE